MYSNVMCPISAERVLPMHACGTVTKLVNDDLQICCVVCGCTCDCFDSVQYAKMVDQATSTTTKTSP